MKALMLAGLALVCAPPGHAQEEDRWQVTLNSGQIIWELRLVRLKGDSLVLRGGDSTYSFPISEVDELRLVRKSERRMTAEPNRYNGVLGGADDVVYRLTLYTLAERRRVLEQAFRDHPPSGG